MNLTPDLKEQIRSFIIEMEEKKVDLREKERDFIKETVVSYLDSDRELRPKEEKLIKQTAKKCNWYLSGLIALCLFILTGGGIMLIKTTKHDIREDIKETANKESREIYNELETEYKLIFEKFKNEMNKEVQDNEIRLRQETYDLKNFVMHSLEDINEKSLKFYETTAKEGARLEGLSEDIKKTETEFEELKLQLENWISEGKAKNADLEKIISDLDEKTEILTEYDELFSLLKEENVKQLTVETDQTKNQKYFRIGQLLIIWGQGKSPKKRDDDKWTDIKFCQKFAPRSDIGLSITPRAKDGFAVIKKVSDQGFTCTILKNESNGPGCFWNEEFRYLAIGKAASES